MKPVLILILAAATLHPVAHAQNFEPYVTEILTNNPALKADRAAMRSEVMARVADNRLEATEIGFDYKWSVDNDETKLGLEVSQSFDWPGVYRARRRAAKSAEQALEARIRATERATALEARTLLCALVDANLRCDMLGKIVNNLDSLHNAMHLMLSHGEITELDHRKVTLSEIAMKQQLADAENERSATLGSIAALNGGQLPGGVADLSEYPAATLKPLAHYLAIDNPDAEALKAEAATDVLDAGVERLGLYPGFSLGYAFEREGLEHFHGFSIGLRLPRYSAKPRAEATKWQARAKELQAEQAMRERRTDIAASHKAAESTAKLIKEYKEAFGADYPHLLKRSLDGGQISYIDYFSELNFYLEARLDYLGRLLAYHTLLARLER